MSNLIIWTILLVAIGGICAFFFLKKQPKKPVAKEEPKPKAPVQTREEKREDKRKQDQKRQNNKSATPKPLETAETVLTCGNSYALAMAFEPTNKYLFVACKNRNQILFPVSKLNKDTSESPQRYKLVDDDIIDCDIKPIDKNNNFEVVCGLDRDKTIKSFIINPSSPHSKPGSVNIEVGAKLTVDKVRIASDMSFVATLGDETYIRVFHPNGNPIITKNTSQMHNSEISVSSNSELVGASSYTKEIVIYGVDRDRAEVPNKVTKAFTVSGHSNSINTFHFSQNDLLFVTGGKDGKFIVWLAPTRWREGDIARQQWSGNTENNEAIALARISPNGNTVALFTESGKLYFYRKTGLVKTVPLAHNAPVTNMEWSPDNSWVVISSQLSPFIYGYHNPE